MLKLILNKLVWLLISVKMFCIILIIILLYQGYLNANCFTKLLSVIIITREVFKEKNFFKFLKLIKRDKK